MPGRRSVSSRQVWDKTELNYLTCGQKVSPPESTKGTWVFLGGTGKLKGIKGKGTFECKSAGDVSSCDIAGEYTLPK